MKDFPIKKDFTVKIGDRKYKNMNKLLDVIETDCCMALMSRIAQIVETLEPKTRTLDVSDIDFGLKNCSIKTISNTMNGLLIETKDSPDKEEKNLTARDVTKICYHLERLYVEPGKRFVGQATVKQFEPNEKEGEVSVIIKNFIRTLNDAVDTSDVNLVANTILAGAEVLVEKSINPEATLKVFSDTVRKKIGKIPARASKKNPVS